MIGRHRPTHSHRPGSALHGTHPCRGRHASWPSSALLAGLLATPPLAAQQGATFEAEFELARSPEVAVLELSYDLPALAQADPTPRLTIFGSGRYVVHRPLYMKQAGDWEGRLARQELDELFAGVVEAGLLDVDYDRLARDLGEHRALAAKASVEGRRFAAVSERETTIIRMRLDRYKPKGVLGVPGEPLEKVLHVSNLGFERGQNPELGTLRALSSLTSRLHALTERPDLERLDPDPGAPVR